MLAFDRQIYEQPEALRLRQQRGNRMPIAVGERDDAAGAQFDHDDGPRASCRSRTDHAGITPSADYERAGYQCNATRKTTQRIACAKGANMKRRQFVAAALTTSPML